MKKVTLFCTFLIFALPAISLSQNVGIGTTTPTLSKLQIQGVVGNNMLVAQPSSGGPGVVLASVSNSPVLGFNLLAPSSNYTRMASGYASMFLFNKTTGDNTYFVSNDGSAGATISPWTAPLVFQGTGNVRVNNYFGVNANGRSDSGRMVITHNSTTSSPTVRLQESVSNSPARLQLSNAGVNRAWQITGVTSASGITSDYLRFWNSGAGDLMQIKGDGSVSIGTTTPATGFKLSVYGKVICEELKVQVKGAWPDYVFSHDYILKPLPQLETFIKDNRHLPGIPNAVTMKTDGLTVGDMQTRMMEKIEELTLYIIDQDKKLKAQQEQLNQQQAEISKLKRGQAN